jgi:nitroreductase
MDFQNMVIRNRSYRRFDESCEISRQTLEELVDLARLSPSAANLQPLKYLISWKKEDNQKIFKNLAWAGYLTKWAGPEPGERPSGYIVILGDREISPTFDYDAGIAAQTILLGAVEKELGGCIIKAMVKENIRKSFNLPDRYEILLTLALGKPVEKVELEPLPVNDSVKYWRDREGVHHVPKRHLKNLIVAPEQYESKK